MVLCNTKRTFTRAPAGMPCQVIFLWVSGPRPDPDEIPVKGSPRPEIASGSPQATPSQFIMSITMGTLKYENGCAPQGGLVLSPIVTPVKTGVQEGP